MKKLFTFIALLFLLSCGKKTYDVTQDINYDGISKKYSITTYFSYPDSYTSHVYCDGSQIDSIRIAEESKAIFTQEEMLRKK